MSDAQSEHEKLVEDVAMRVGGMVLKHLEVLIEFDVAKDITQDMLKFVLSRLHDVTPEMMEAWENAEPIHTGLGGYADKAIADWRAMLAASCLSERKL